MFSSILTIRSIMAILSGTGAAQSSINDNRGDRRQEKSGSPNTGFGVIYCFQDSSNFYRLLITTTGAYNVVRKVAGTYYLILDWAYTGNLHQGYGVTNTIKITRNSSSQFAVYFNNVSVCSFTDTSFTGGDYGFYAAVSSTNESFPNTPVDVRFNQLQPSKSILGTAGRSAAAGRNGSAAYTEI